MPDGITRLKKLIHLQLFECGTMEGDFPLDQLTSLKHLRCVSMDACFDSFLYSYLLFCLLCASYILDEDEIMEFYEDWDEEKEDDEKVEKPLLFLS